MSLCQWDLSLTLSLFVTLSLGEMDSCSSCMTSRTEVDDESALKAGDGGGLFCIKALLFHLEMTI